MQRKQHYDPPQRKGEQLGRVVVYMMHCCGICRHSERYVAPEQPEPRRPQKPKYGDGYIGASLYFYLAQSNRWTVWFNKQERFERKVECRRFPAFVERAKADLCSEFDAEPLGPVEIEA